MTPDLVGVDEFPHLHSHTSLGATSLIDNKKKTDNLIFPTKKEYRQGQEKLHLQELRMKKVIVL